MLKAKAKPRPSAERVAKSRTLITAHLEPYTCDMCGGRAVIGGRLVRVRHSVDCPRDRMIRLRWPHLRGGVQSDSSLTACVTGRNQ